MNKQAKQNRNKVRVIAKAVRKQDAARQSHMLFLAAITLIALVLTVWSPGQ